jgi:hypothetical protein
MVEIKLLFQVSVVILPAYTACDDGTVSVFQNVGTNNSHWGIAQKKEYNK